MDEYQLDSDLARLAGSIGLLARYVRGLIEHGPPDAAQAVELGAWLGRISDEAQDINLRRRP